MGDLLSFVLVMIACFFILVRRAVLSLLGWITTFVRWLIRIPVTEQRESRGTHSETYEVENEADDDSVDENEGMDTNEGDYTPFAFDWRLSQDQFNETVYSVTRRIKRIESTQIENGVIYCKVRSQSGISRWLFTVDFNDDGCVTGRYSAWRENTDSDIPWNVAKEISERIAEAITVNLDSRRESRRIFSCPKCERRFAVPWTINNIRTFALVAVKRCS